MAPQARGDILRLRRAGRALRGPLNADVRHHEMSDVRAAVLDDVPAISRIHRQAFPRQVQSKVWVRATVVAYPRYLSFVLTEEGAIAGYIFWSQKSGIRTRSVLELDQIAVSEALRNRGLGAHLIRESLVSVRNSLRDNCQEVGAIIVSTSTNNAAQKLYAKVLGARPEAELRDLFSSTEIIMVVRP